MKYYICPVCGYDKIDEPPYGIGGSPSYNICSCCGFEYGYSEDFEVEHKAIVLPKSQLNWAFQQYLKQWVNDGCKVFDEEDFTNEEVENGILKKEIFEEQLKRIDINIDDIL
ncbi:hypothetical protein MHJ97_11470 [Macrococcus epidermidis]|uniref:hypothetical protein n=1 Tax=Macrococcus epidermidis TaxID=1902580 RepID=UPI001EF34E72|nr:hypothetical protein [Macrococcus epidermidis]MCG7421042.1 hypothetical protein [Macrococcus epidermidis]